MLIAQDHHIYIIFAGLVSLTIGQSANVPPDPFTDIGKRRRYYISFQLILDFLNFINICGKIRVLETNS